MTPFTNNPRSLLFAALLLAAGTAFAAPPPKSIMVGTLKLKFCNEDYGGYCGSIKRPLDPTGGIKGTINVGFEYYPRHDQTRPALGTILPQEGGPGYSSTGTRDAYINIFEPLRDRRDIVIVDKRGTGTSGALNCQKIQTGDPNDPAGLKACAKKLGGKAWLYGTTLAVGDIVAVLDALRISEVDYYGDSYGTYVGQVFAARFPQPPAQHHPRQCVSRARARRLVSNRLGHRARRARPGLQPIALMPRAGWQSPRRESKRC